MTRHYRLLRWLSRLAPESLTGFVRRHVPVPGYDQWLGKCEDPYASEAPAFDSPQSPCVLGILKDRHHYHTSYIAACREMGISYRLVDIARDDWVRALEESACDAYLVWPSAITSVLKGMVEDRMRLMEEQLGKLLCPALHEVWLYENKPRTRDWLLAKRLPHPRTWVFFDRDEATAFLNEAEFPLVFKTNSGAAASGVYVLQRKSAGEAVVRRAFSRGIAPRRSPQNRQWGNVLFQEFLPDVKEWRMIRIGDSYFGYLKGRVGEFHSGTHLKEWLDPPRTHLDLLREVTEIGQFTSMNADLFETKDGRLLINELHTVFGQSTREQMRVNGKAGRYLYDAGDDRWVFEEGDFARNACANCRIEYLIRAILKKA